MTSPPLTSKRVKELQHLYATNPNGPADEDIATLLDELLSLREQLMAMREREQWQPIETAPRGQWLLCGRVGAASKFNRFVGYILKRGECADANNGLRDPTHWRPLPPAPSTGEGQT